MAMLAGRLDALDEPPEIDLIYGEQAGDRIVDVGSDLPGRVRLHLCSEDGAAGQKGLVTGLFRPLIAGCESPPAVYCCGPGPMMAALAGLVSPEKTALFEVSTEENMACGKGICKGCVIPMATPDSSVSYRYCCTDGPVFNGFEVKWPHA
jgi:dihydroorotate dehydrogenase electron transfer subunit